MRTRAWPAAAKVFTSAALVDPERLEEAGHLGAQDERLADGLDHVVRDEDQEDVHEHEEGAGSLAGADLGEQAEKAVEGAGPTRGRGDVGRVHVTSRSMAPRMSGTTIDRDTEFRAPAPSRQPGWQETDSRASGRPRLDSTVDPWRRWNAFETGAGSSVAGRRHGRRRARRGDADGGRRAAVQGGRLPRARVRQGLPRPVDDPDRGARPRPAEDRRRADAGPRGRPGPGPRPRVQGSRRARLHVPLPAQAPRTDDARGVARPLPGEDRTGPELPHPPRRRPDPRVAAGGGRRRPHEPAPRGRARRPGARRVPQDLRRRVRDDRRVPSPGRGRAARLHGTRRRSSPPPSCGSAGSPARRTGSTAGLSFGPASSTSGSTTSTATAGSGAGCGSPARSSCSRCRRTRTWSSSATTGW